MNILITGGAGFIGSHLTEMLVKRGHRAWILDDFNDYYDPRIKEANIAVLPPAATIVRGDIRDAALCLKLGKEGRFEVIYHLAARAGVRPSLQQPALYTEVNCLGTVNVLEAARACGCRKFVFASSSSVYGNLTPTPFRETDDVSFPISPYAATKKAGELLCYNYHHLYQLPVACLRFFTVYGPRQRPDMAIHKFTRMIAGGEPLTRYGDGGTSRDYTFIEDIVAGCAALLDVEFGYEILNLGNSHAVPLSRLIALIEEAVGRRAVIQEAGIPPGDVQATFADISRASRLLGYRPRVAIEEGIPRFVAWWRQA